MIIQCWHDGREKDAAVCERRRKSARAIKRAGKPVEMVQCLKCTKKKEISLIVENFSNKTPISMTCLRCGKDLIGYTKRREYCSSCAQVRKNAKGRKVTKATRDRYNKARRAKRAAGKKQAD